jgi:hypothetical protein
VETEKPEVPATPADKIKPIPAARVAGEPKRESERKLEAIERDVRNLRLQDYKLAGWTFDWSAYYICLCKPDYRMLPLVEKYLANKGTRRTWFLTKSKTGRRTLYLPGSQSKKSRSVLANFSQTEKDVGERYIAEKIFLWAKRAQWIIATHARSTKGIVAVDKNLPPMERRLELVRRFQEHTQETSERMKKLEEQAKTLGNLTKLTQATGLFATAHLFVLPDDCVNAILDGRALPSPDPVDDDSSDEDAE